jgi:hypothetical protein
MSKKTLSLDLRERVVAAVAGGVSRRQAAERFGVSAAKDYAAHCFDGCGANSRNRRGSTSKTWFGLCSENCIPNFRRGFAIDAKPCEFELALPDPMHQFDACYRDLRAAKALQSEHWIQAKRQKSPIVRQHTAFSPRLRLNR